MQTSWQFWALLSAFFAGLTALLAKIGVQTIDSDLATLLRTCVILLVLMLFVTAKSGWTTIGNVTPHAGLFLVLSGVATGASWVCYFRALKLGDVARVAPIDKLSVVIVALLGVFVLGEHLTALHWIGISMIATGAVILAI